MSTHSIYFCGKIRKWFYLDMSLILNNINYTCTSFFLMTSLTLTPPPRNVYEVGGLLSRASSGMGGNVSPSFRFFLLSNSYKLRYFSAKSWDLSSSCFISFSFISAAKWKTEIEVKLLFCFICFYKTKFMRKFTRCLLTTPVQCTRFLVLHSKNYTLYKLSKRFWSVLGIHALHS